ncbi:MAG TPA: hypothetical protein VIY48_18795 [Candidatus Paceibacterota bacterium]
MSEISKYEKMLKDNNAAIKKLQERGKQIAAVIKLLKSLDAPEEDGVVASTFSESRTPTIDDLESSS